MQSPNPQLASERLQLALAGLLLQLLLLKTVAPQRVPGGGGGQAVQLGQDECCACEDAKYELVFEGLWSKYTHPDDYPDNNWLASFGDIIGASHSSMFKMWQHDSYASEGVKELAQTGSTKRLESELKQVSSKTRTIIKARELLFPTLNSKTSAVFRTDRMHHLVSILSKLKPSPDWMVGVSSLELCQADCSWVPQKTINLYPWDAGTDSGRTFAEPQAPTIPQERIHLYTSRAATGPPTSNDKPSPSEFVNLSAPGNSLFDSSSNSSSSSSSGSLMMDSNQTQQSQEQLKPFARLTITRQRIYGDSCNSPGESNYNDAHKVPSPSSLPEWPPTTGMATPTDCRLSEWSDWSSCSSSCGKGMRTRTRNFKDEASTSQCPDAALIEKEVCLSECVGSTVCVTRNWSEWSRCSLDCGTGRRKRTRALIGRHHADCKKTELAQEEPCTGNPDAECPEPEETRCKVSNWTKWTACSSSCGDGVRIRHRQHLTPESMDSCRTTLYQKQSCSGLRCPKKMEKDTCGLAPDVGPCKANQTRWFYERSSNSCRPFQFGGCLGNKNNFATIQRCQNHCFETLVAS